MPIICLSVEAFTTWLLTATGSELQTEQGTTGNSSPSSPLVAVWPEKRESESSGDSRSLFHPIGGQESRRNAEIFRSKTKKRMNRKIVVFLSSLYCSSDLIRSSSFYIPWWWSKEDSQTFSESPLLGSVCRQHEDQVGQQSSVPVRPFHEEPYCDLRIA